MRPLITGFYKEIVQESLEIKQYELNYDTTPSDTKPYQFTILGSTELQKSFVVQNNEGVAVESHSYYNKKFD